MSDYISREELNQWWTPIDSTDLPTDRCLMVVLVDDIPSIPSADVRENIHARWESDGHGHIICTACKKAKLNTHRSKFCDSCGAIMDGKRECEHCSCHEENGCTRWFCIDAEADPKEGE